MLKKDRILVIGIIFFGSIFLMLSKLDTGSSNVDYIPSSAEDVKNLHKKLKFVEQQLDMNKRAMKEVKDVIEVFLKKGNIHDPKQRAELENLMVNVNSHVSNRIHSRSGEIHTENHNMSSICPLLPHTIDSADIDMIKVYEKLPFEDPDGGVWKQGFPIVTSDDEWSNRKLKVFVVPHSHNDPGWIKTVEKYFHDQTRHILDSVVDALSQDSKRRFIWAEMSYLSMWWDIASSDRKVKLKKLVDNGQLEMVTAGWVMNDEANTHYFAMIDQMIEGNEWLSINLGVVPRSGWAIDPFGHSPTMAYVLKKMNFKNMLIQRVHYAIKKYLATEKLLEFRWRQAWSETPNTDIVCHMMPFYSYDVPHTCGPDPKICCQFDFARLPGQSKYSCPWRVPPVAINDGNVAARSLILLDQYRKKSKLFKTDTLLVILGDDFRYSDSRETTNQFENYAKIFDYINSNPKLNAELKFGTLSEYFDAMKADTGGEENLPALSGDFFTYADREDHYWSGYYTSRPFHKMLDRVLESHLRGAEILFSLALSLLRSSGSQETFIRSLYPLLVESRRSLGLFQHHDGITGTAKDHVVVDYGTKMIKSLINTNKIHSLCAQALLTLDLSTFNPDVIEFDYDEIYREQNQAPQRQTIMISEGSSATVIVYNSLAYRRTGVVSLFVSTPHIAVYSSQNQIISSQTNLVWKSGVESEENKYEIQFLATVPSTGLATYIIKISNENQFNTFSTIHMYNGNAASRGPFKVSPVPSGGALTIENEFFVVDFSSSSGYLKTITDKLTKKTNKVELSFTAYKSRSAKDKSGAYLFLPAGPSTPHVGDFHHPLIRCIRGSISSEVHVTLPNLLHRVILYNGNGDGTQALGVHIHNDVDLRSGYDNKEIAMRLETSIRSGNKFFTDLNGFQTQQRTNYDKLPLQANFYPIPGMAFIQDDDSRLTLLTGQPLGVASLKEGVLEVIMERRLMQDDNRGLGQGVRDNVLTPESFVILVEHWDKPPVQNPSSTLSYPSLAAHRMSWELLHQLRIMTLKKNVHIKPGFDSLLGRSLPCDVHLLNLRTIQSRDHVTATDQSALILHRVGRDCGFDSDQRFKSCQSSVSYDIPIDSLFPVSDVTMTSLSLQEDAGKIESGGSITVRPMEVEAFKVRLR